MGADGEAVVTGHLLLRESRLRFRLPFPRDRREGLGDQQPQAAAVLPAGVVVEGGLSQGVDDDVTFFGHLVGEFAGAEGIVELFLQEFRAGQ